MATPQEIIWIIKQNGGQEIMVKRFSAEDLATSKNHFIKRLKWQNWHCIPGVDFVSDPQVLLKDALRNLRINGKLFRESTLFSNLSAELKQAAASSDISSLEPFFKQFVKQELFPHLSDGLAEQEYHRLQNAYGQPVAGAALSAMNDSACERFKKPNSKITASLASLRKVDNLTYQDGAFGLDSCVTDLTYSWCDNASTPDEEPNEVILSLPTVINYRCSLPSNETSFITQYLETSNSYSEALIFEEEIDVGKLIALENEAEQTRVLNQYHEACENYKDELKNSLFSDLQKEDPRLAAYLQAQSLTLQVVDNVLDDDQSSSKIVMASNKETGLDSLVNSPDMKEKITAFSKPTQLAIKKYKVMCDLQTITRTKNELALDSIRNFNDVLEKNIPLLKTSRDTGVETFFKVVASIATFGLAAPYLFSTRGHEFIEKVSSVFNNKQAQPASSAQKAEVAQLSYTPAGYVH